MVCDAMNRKQGACRRKNKGGEWFRSIPMTNQMIISSRKRHHNKKYIATVSTRLNLIEVALNTFGAHTKHKGNYTKKANGWKGRHIFFRHLV
ncbi:hypothetical protein CMK22_16520 [Candidatus Poribacteria bacterium]|nr:hypothetical protein [Candidatus Poribacteria bacterium]